MNFYVRLHLFIFLILSAGLVSAQGGAKLNTGQRARWFEHGRTVPGQSTASLRYRAQQQKLRLRTLRALPRAAGAGALPQVAVGTIWTSLGPAPLASDASGLGVQDYGPVSGRATAVAVDPADASGNTVYAGAAYGGVWKSSNAGPASPDPASVKWTALTDNQPTLAMGQSRSNRS